METLVNKGEDCARNLSKKMNLVSGVNGKQHDIVSLSNIFPSDFEKALVVHLIKSTVTCYWYYVLLDAKSGIDCSYESESAGFIRAKVAKLIKPIGMPGT